MRCKKNMKNLGAYLMNKIGVLGEVKPFLQDQANKLRSGNNQANLNGEVE
jgi:hypothetical protein